MNRINIPKSLRNDIIVDHKETWWDGEHGGVFAYSLSTGQMIQVGIAREDSLRKWWNEFIDSVKTGQKISTEDLKSLASSYEEIWDEDYSTGESEFKGYTADSVWRASAAKEILFHRGVEVE